MSPSKLAWLKSEMQTIAVVALNRHPHDEAAALAEMERVYARRPDVRQATLQWLIERSLLQCIARLDQVGAERRDAGN